MMCVMAWQADQLNLPQIYSNGSHLSSLTISLCAVIVFYDWNNNSLDRKNITMEGEANYHSLAPSFVP